MKPERQNTFQPDLDFKQPYIPRGTNVLQCIFKDHFADFKEQYDEKYAKTYGNYRIERITEVVEKFIKCGDYREGLARIKCQNPECGHDYFIPLSCKGFYLCPSCHQKRTLLFGEQIVQDVLLKLPHRQFVFTLPKALRVFFKHDRLLFSDISNLIFDMIQLYYDEASTPKYNDYFKENFKSFDVLDFIAEVTVYIPPKHKEYIRRYGLYSSRTRGIWERFDYIIRLAPLGWKEKHNQKAALEASLTDIKECSPDEKKKKSAWARLIKKVYGVDPLVCPCCGFKMKILAIIFDPEMRANTRFLNRRIIPTIPYG